MRISPVNFTKQNVNQNFKGIKHLDYRDSHDDHTQEVFVDIDYYNYYPFKDETHDEIAKNTYPLDRTEYHGHPYPRYSEYSGEKITIMPPLSITKAQYEALKSQKVDDDFIVKTFA